MVTLLIISQKYRFLYNYLLASSWK